MQSITQWLKTRRLPCICTLCSQRHAGIDAVCEACHAFLTPISSACSRCGIPLPEGTFMTCGACIQKQPYFDQTIAPFAFEEPLRTLLHEFKYKKSLYLVSFLSKLIINHLPSNAHQTECLIPVPMHISRLRHRGFNQAAELTKFIGNVLNIPYQLNMCKKIIPTMPQAALNAKQRQKNLLNVFQVGPTHYKRVTLIDDLLTTGSTANELAKMLKQQGVEYVSIWCCARVFDNHTRSHRPSMSI